MVTMLSRYWWMDPILKLPEEPRQALMGDNHRDPLVCTAELQPATVRCMGVLDCPGPEYRSDPLK